MKKVLKTTLVFMLALMLIIPSFGLESVNAASEPSFDVTWQDASGTIVGEGDSIMVEPIKTNNEKSSENFIKAQLKFSCDGTTSYAPGELEFRLPVSLFTDRDGNNVTDYEVGVPLAPEKNDISDFNYYVDNDTDEIIITNHSIINKRSTFGAEIKYSYNPMNIEDGSNHDLTAKALINKDGEITNIEEPKTITVKVDTDVELTDAKKVAQTKYEKWQNDWGEEPENSSDYVYIRYYFQTSIKYSQPYSYYIDEKPGNGGKLLAYSTTTAGNPVWIRCDASELSEVPWTRASSFTYIAGYLLVAYPKNQLSESEPTDIVNDMTLRLESADGVSLSRDCSSTYTYTFPDPSALNGKGFDYYMLKNSSTATGQYLALLKKGIPAKIYYDTQTTLTGNVFTKSGEDYGVKNYTNEFIDDQIYLDGELLEPGDYSFGGTQRFAISATNVKLDEDLGKYEVKSNTREENLEIECKFYYRTEQNGTWHEVEGSLSDDNKVYPEYVVNFPENAYQIKVAATGNDYQIVIWGRDISVQLNPTDHVKKLIKDKTLATLTNYSALRPLKDDGSLAEQTTGSNPIAAHDQNNGYGITGTGALFHAKAERELTDTLAYGYSNKTGTAKLTDDRSKYILSYTLNQLAAFSDDKEIVQELKDAGIDLAMHNSTFYDLLPRGAFPDLNSIEVYKLKGNYSFTLGSPTSVSRDSKCSSDDFQIKTIDNWRDSGRTMLIVTVNSPDAKDTNGQSGFQLAFNADYSINSLNDYGIKLENNAVMQSDDIIYADGGKDDSKDKLLFDINNDGNPEDTTTANTRYANVTNTLSQVSAYQTGFSKQVKSAEESEYTAQAQALPDGMYSYNLRFGVSDNVAAKDMTFYDVLEDAYGSNAHWQGTLDSIDVSQATKSGVDAKVYYSTQSGLDPENNSNHADLSNSAIWSETPPADLSTVKALAFDLSKNKAGEDFILDNMGSLVCTVYMKAPSDYKDYINPLVYAYNQATCASKARTDTSNQWSSEDVKKSATTKVSILEQFGDLSISKALKGKNADADKEFTFTVTLDDKTVNGTYGDMTFADGVATVILKDGESAIAENLPSYLSYTVTEADYTSENYVAKQRTYNGKIVANETKEIEFENTYYSKGGLSITKNLEGNDLVKGDEFDFTITLDDKTITGTYSGVDFKDGVATITIKGSGTKTITGIPADVGYKVEEEDYTDDGYTTEANNKEGTIKNNEVSAVTFTNTRNTYGEIKVTKSVEGNSGDKQKAFQFTMTLGDEEIKGKYGDMTFEAGIAKFQLKDGESISAAKLPNGITYDIVEDDYSSDGYITTVNNASGTISGGETITADFTNTKNVTVTPGKGDGDNEVITGDSSNILGFIILMLTALALALTVIFVKRKRV